jgi:hypothetical protein
MSDRPVCDLGLSSPYRTAWAEVTRVGKAAAPRASGGLSQGRISHAGASRQHRREKLAKTRFP